MVLVSSDWPYFLRHVNERGLTDPVLVISSAGGFHHSAHSDSGARSERL